MGGEVLEIGVFSMADEDAELQGRFGLEEVGERLRTERSETGGVVQLVKDWLVDRDLASMNRGGTEVWDDRKCRADQLAGVRK